MGDAIGETRRDYTIWVENNTFSEGVRLECWLLYFIGLLFVYYDYGYCHVIGVLGEMPRPIWKGK